MEIVDPTLHAVCQSLTSLIPLSCTGITGLDFSLVSSDSAYLKIYVGIGQKKMTIILLCYLYIRAIVDTDEYTNW
jgi:hypothetical protein